MKNHRTNLKDNHQFLHQKKDQLNINEVCGKVESKHRLNLSKAGDRRAWKELDNEMPEALVSLPIYKDPTVELERRKTFIYSFLKEKYDIKGYFTSNKKLTCFVLYLKILNTLLKNNTFILEYIVRGTQKWY